jgi:arsenate reductase
VCPVWPGGPLKAHWGVDDPAAIAGTEEQKAHFFSIIYTQLQSRIRILTSLPLDKLDQAALQTRLQDIGQT